MMKFNEITKKLNSSVINSSLTNHPDNNPNIVGLAPVDEAITGQLSYIEGDKFAPMVNKTAASALILPLDEALQNQASERGIAWIASKEPRLIFAQAINFFYKPFHPAPGIHPSAIIDPSVKLGKDIYIGPHVVIEHDVTIGDNVCIHSNVVIYPQVFLGSHSILHANCTIHECTQIGSHCVIHSGAAIGSEGFGFVPTPQGWFKIEQSGYVILEDGVEIGCNSAVDRPAVGTTNIGRNTKLDNLVHIAHGCKISENCILAGQVGLAGGVKLGSRVILAGQVGVANQINIGDGVIATGQTGITSDIAPGEIISSSPAVPHKLYMKVSAIYKRLPEMYKTLKRLQKKIE